MAGERIIISKAVMEEGILGVKHSVRKRCYLFLRRGGGRWWWVWRGPFSALCLGMAEIMEGPGAGARRGAVR